MSAQVSVGLLDYWFLLPVGVAVAGVATSAGVSGSNFWIPIYLRWLDLEPRLVFWMSLVTMLFGFGSAVVRNLIARTIDWALVRRYGAVAAPAAAAAALLAARAPQTVLLAAFSVFAFVYGLVLIAGSRSGKQRVVLPWSLAALAGGASQGLIATGAGTFTLPSMLAEKKEQPARSIGASVFLIFGCTLVAAAFRIDSQLVVALETHGRSLAAMIVFAVPGVVVGGQLGPRLARRLSPRAVRPYVGVILLVVALLVATRWV